MFDGLGMIGLVMNINDFVKEKREKVIPAENWNNKHLMYEDKINPDISPEEFMKNLEKGKYCSSTEIPVHYEKPVKIVDRERYEHDIIEYGREVANDNAKLGMYSFVLKM